MSFVFFNPWFWLGAFAVGAPIWLHLRRRTETNVVRFSAVLSGFLFALTYPVRLLWRTIRSGRVLARAVAGPTRWRSSPRAVPVQARRYGFATQDSSPPPAQRLRST